jgi:VanZ family protein
MRNASIAYLVLLTLALVVPNPLDFLPGRRDLIATYRAIQPVVHFVSFVPLTVLALAAPWPLRRAWVVALLAAYGLATELAQTLVPHRTPALSDFVQDLAGIGVGLAAWGLGRTFLAGRKAENSGRTRE